MKDKNRFETRVLWLLVIIVVLLITILFKQFQTEERIMESLEGLYFDMIQLVK